MLFCYHLDFAKTLDQYSPLLFEIQFFVVDLIASLSRVLFLRPALCDSPASCCQLC
jgi:hypothetical protein